MVEPERVERLERGTSIADDPGGSADSVVRGRDREHIEERSPDDFDEVDEEDEVSDG